MPLSPMHYFGKQSNRARSKMGAHLSTVSSSAAGSLSIPSAADNKTASSKRVTKNRQARRKFHRRQQTLDSGYGSGTMLSGSSTCSDEMSEGDHYCGDEVKHTTGVLHERQPEPYDGLLMPGENVPDTPAEAAATAAHVVSYRKSIFQFRRNQDWRNISVFYEDDEYRDYDETHASRYLFNPLKPIKPIEYSEEELEEERERKREEELYRRRLYSLFGADPDPTTT